MIFICINIIFGINVYCLKYIINLLCRKVLGFVEFVGEWYDYNI